MATETHIASADVEIEGRYLMQRCGWCGAVLLSYDYERVAMVGEWQKPATFPAGALVRFTYDGEVARWGEVALTRTGMWVLEGFKLPEDACALNIPFELVVPQESEPTCGVEIPGIGPCTEPPGEHEVHRRGAASWNAPG